MFDIAWTRDGVVWNDVYDTGVDEMDREHRGLMDLINKLDLALKDGEGLGRVLDLLSDLRQSTIDHFQHEEALMESAEYPSIAHHKDLHALLVKLLEDLMEQAKAGNRQVLERHASEYLKTWLVSHIMVADKAYASCVMARDL